jgi:thiol-disulfide isomerase/thioredoxin
MTSTTTTAGLPSLDTAFLKEKFEAGLTYDDYVATGKPEQQELWAKVHDAIALNDQQRSLLAGFTRDMKILVTSGMWCGDCSAQCPILARIAETNPERIEVRFLDRDAHADLADRVMINDGLRVPTVIFLAEDYVFIHMLGDRTLTRYRAIAERQLGAACPLPGAPVPEAETAATIKDWLNEVERVQLLLRLSPRLREIHGD